jgi:ElaB/YqjD/DUF883 family membrane-anchored ribosome-binding protein
MSDIANRNTSSAPGGGSSANRSGGKSSSIADRADDLVGQGKDAASDMTGKAQDAAQQLKSSAASLAREGSERLADVLSKQLSTGASLVEDATESLRSAAAELDQTLPPVAFLLRNAASRGDDIAELIRTKSLGELLEEGSDYARRNPLLIFGVAAGVGMLLSRFAKSTAEGSMQANLPSRARPSQSGPRSAHSSSSAHSSTSMGTGGSSGRSPAANI